MQTELNAAPRRVSAAGIVAPARKPEPPRSTTTPPTVAPTRTSAAGLTAPIRRAASLAIPATESLAQTKSTQKAPRTRAEQAALFDRLRALRDSLPPNKNDRAAVLISACIGEGVRSGPGIVEALAHLHFLHGHAEAILRSGTGVSWSRGQDGRFSLLG